MDRLLERINNGQGDPADVNLLGDVAKQISGKCLCPLGDFSTSAVVSGLELFRDDFEQHVPRGNQTAEKISG